ncbi:hypothetical protein DH2020_003585 [Rehmannia glutinosa]|uniref:Demethylphylloquinone methyltransferase n=1 Tax=Rehmannia glutinosa TaxID=99300 RepID=A0ABR0XM37_REHGL
MATLRRRSEPQTVTHESATERQELFNRIAPVYDKLNDLFSLGLHRLWKRWTISWSEAKEGDKVLDACCGSGDLSFRLSEKVGIHGKVIALDFSKELLEIAASRQREHERSKPCYKNIEWIEGDAVALPFSDSTFDAATIGYGLRNIVDRKKLWRRCIDWYGLASEYRYLKNSIKEYLTGPELEKLALEAGFSEAKFYEISNGSMGILVAKR